MTYSCNTKHGCPCFRATIPTAIIFCRHDRVRGAFSEIIVDRLCQR
ncbi:hypothetical protein P3T21_002096 [Paraburkholderia sp. GAS334]